MVTTGLFESAIGVLVGIIIGLVLNILVQWKSARNSRMNLRRALIAELESADYILKQASSESKGSPIVLDNIPSTIYESNADSIGGLSREEVKRITSYYSLLDARQVVGITSSPEEMIEDVLQSTPNKPQENNDEREALKECLLAEYEEPIKQRRIESQISGLETRRDHAIESLQVNLSDSIAISIVNCMPRLRSHIKFVFDEIRTPEGWEELSEKQCNMLVAIGNLHGLESFTINDFKSEFRSKNLGRKFGEEEPLKPKERTLVSLQIRNLIVRENGKYKLNDRQGQTIMNEYYRDQLDSEIKKEVPLGYG